MNVSKPGINNKYMSPFYNKYKISDDECQRNDDDDDDDDDDNIFRYVDAPVIKV